MMTSSAVDQAAWLFIRFLTVVYRWLQQMIDFVANGVAFKRRLIQLMTELKLCYFGFFIQCYKP